MREAAMVTYASRTPPPTSPRCQLRLVRHDIIYNAINKPTHQPPTHFAPRFAFEAAIQAFSQPFLWMAMVAGIVSDVGPSSSLTGPDGLEDDSGAAKEEQTGESVRETKKATTDQQQKQQNLLTNARRLPTTKTKNALSPKRTST